MARNRLFGPKRYLRAVAPSALALVSMCAVADNGYLVLAGGGTRGSFTDTPSTGTDSRVGFRIAAGMEMSPRLGMEVGIFRAKGFPPTEEVVARDSRARINVTGIDVAMVARFAPTRSFQMFATIGPMLSSVRAEIPVAKGRATALRTAQSLTWRVSGGVEMAVSDSLALQLAVSHIGSVGTSSGSSMTGQSAIESVLLGAVILF